MSNEEEKLTAIIGIRVCPSFKGQLMEEAIEKGKTLSDYLVELIEAGWEEINGEDVKQEDENGPRVSNNGSNN